MQRLRILLILFGVLLCSIAVLPLISHAAVSFVKRPIPTNGLYVDNLSGTRLLEEQSIANPGQLPSSNLFLYDIVNNTSTQLTNDNVSNNGVIYKNYVAWTHTEEDPSTHHWWSSVRYCILSAVGVCDQKVIENEGARPFSDGTSISDKGIAWIDSNENCPNGNDNCSMDIVQFYDFASKTTTSTYSTQNSNHSIETVVTSGNIVAWVEWTANDATAYLKIYDFTKPASQRIKQVTSNPTLDEIFLRGDLLVYTNNDSSGRLQVYVYTISTGATRQVTHLTNNTSYPSDLDIVNNYVVWDDGRASVFDTSRATLSLTHGNPLLVAANDHVFLYDLTAGIEQQVTFDANSQAVLAASDLGILVDNYYQPPGTIVQDPAGNYVRYPDPMDQGTYLYLFPLPGGPPPPTCVQATPSVSVLPNAFAGSPGNTATYTLTIQNNDSVGCSNTIFSVNTLAPKSGWQVSAPSTSQPIASGAKIQLSLTATSPSNAISEEYVVTSTIARFDPAKQTPGSTIASGAFRYKVSAVCTQLSPVVSIMPQSQNGIRGSSSTFSITLTDTDSAKCTPFAFVANEVLPLRWYTTSQNIVFTAYPGTSVTKNFTITIPTSTALVHEGTTYKIPVNVYRYGSVAIPPGGTASSPWASGAVQYTVRHTIPDTTAPTIQILFPNSLGSFITTSTMVNIGAVITDPDDAYQTVTATWKNTTTGQSGSVLPTNYGWWALNVPLNIGTNVMTVTAKDAAGNSTSTTFLATRALTASATWSDSIANILDALTALLRELQSSFATQ